MLRSCENEKSGDGAATCGVHDSEDGAWAPDSIVAEGLDDLDAAPGWRFACWPFRAAIGADVSIVVGGERASEKFSGVRLRVARDLFRRAGGDDFAALIAAFGAEIDQPVGGFDDVEIVLDDHERRAGFEQFAERGEELGDVVEMQAGRRLVEDVEDLFILAAREMRREF